TATTSPPGFVWLTARANERHGVATAQLLASFPRTDTAVRLSWASARDARAAACAMATPITIRRRFIGLLCRRLARAPPLGRHALPRVANTTLFCADTKVVTSSGALLRAPPVR